MQSEVLTSTAAVHYARAAGDILQVGEASARHPAAVHGGVGVGDDYNAEANRGRLGSINAQQEKRASINAVEWVRGN